MNKVTIGIISLIAVLLLGGVYLAGSSDDEEANADPSSAVTNTTTNDSTPSEPAIELESTGASTIQEYSPEALAASDAEANILFFHAAWCTVCNSVERNIEAGSIPDSLAIFKVDYDSDIGKELARLHKIPIQYTMVQVTPDGSEITQWVNTFGDGIDEVVARVQ